MAETIILVADSRKDVRQEMTVLLQEQNPDLRIVMAESGANALEKLPLRPFRALLTVPHLPDMSGLKLIQQARQQRPDLNVIVLVDAGQNDIRELYDHMHIPCFERHDTEALLARIRTYAAPVEKQKSGIEGLRLEEAVQRLCTRSETAQIRVISSEGIGAINIENGQMVHAHAPDTKGEEAYRVMLTWPNATLEHVHIVKSDVQTIYKPWQNVVREAEERVRLDAEQKRKAGPHPSKPLIQKPLTAAATSAGSANIWVDRARAEGIERPDRLRPRWIFVILLVLTTVIAGARFVFFYEDLVLLFPWLAEHRAASEPAVKTPPPRIVTRKNFVIPAELQTSRWEMCRAEHASHAEIKETANGILLSAATFDALELSGAAWVELIGPHGSRLGAFAVRHEMEPAEKVVVLREAIFRALDLDPEYTTEVAVRPITWATLQPTAEEIAFGRVRVLPAEYCEHWFAVGLALATMQEHNLRPGDYAIVKGPAGFQSATIQLMDRGNPGEVWLSESVREVIDIQSPRDRVTVHPKAR